VNCRPDLPAMHVRQVQNESTAALPGRNPAELSALFQVLCCEVDGIFDTLVSNNDLLGYLFSILEQARPLNSTRAGYFARVLASLLTKCSSPVMQFVQGRAQYKLAPCDLDFILLY